MKYLLVLFSLVLFACGQEAETDSGNPSNNKIDSLQKEITTLDSLNLTCIELENSLKELEFLAKLWVKEQKTSDSEDKMQLLEVEKKCLNQLQEIENNAQNEFKDIAKSLRADLDSVLLITKEIRTLLPDFASYEDITNLFFAQVLVDGDGELILKLMPLYYHTGRMKQLLLLKKEKLVLEIKKMQAES